MGTVHQKFTGDARQLEQEYQKLLAQQIKMEEQQRKLALAADKAAQAAKAQQNVVIQGAGKVVEGLKAMALQYASVQAAMELVRREHEFTAQNQKRSLDASLRVAQAEGGVMVNIGPLSRDEKLNYLDDVRNIRAETSFESVAPLMEAAEALLSTTAQNTKLSNDVLRESAPLFRLRPEDLPDGADSVAKLSVLTEATAKESMGLMLNAFGQTAINALPNLKNFTPAIAAAVVSQQGTDKKQAALEGAAAFAAIGGRVTDSDGSITKTAVTALSAALERNFPEGGSLAQRLDLAQDIGERVAKAGKDASPADKAILEDLIKTGFEGPTKMVARDLFAGHRTDTAKAFDSAMSKISYDTNAVDELKKDLQGATPSLFMASREKGHEGQVEDSMVASKAAMDGFIKSQLDRAMEAPTNLQDTWLSNSAFKLRRFIFGTSAEEAIDILDRREQSVFDKSHVRVRDPDGYFKDKELRPEDYDATDINQLKIIQSARESIKEMMQMQKELLERQQRRGNAAVQATIHNERN